MSNESSNETRDKDNDKLFSASLTLPLYARKGFALPLVIVFAICDILGFKQVVETNIPTNDVQSFSIIIGLSAAFEIAPIYIGYAICQKCYSLGTQGIEEIKNRKIPSMSTFVLIFSILACILGIGANVIFRFLTISSLHDKTKLAETIIMCTIPVITSLVNLSVGCLSFDPLIMDIFNLSKRLAKLKAKKRQIKSILKEIKVYLNDNVINLYNEELERFNNELDTERQRLKKYIRVFLEEQETPSNLNEEN